ncbi:protein translocase subunit SecD [Clostridium tarantellae]|uniref:Protein translocase subunit SecD n=1 Tax=Clostridium tarantellae TaxID=39493 RepID=A0A6I1MJC2_9CLOT|nr:protein translocase subunit SecD [Clostridium tarantellae]MPQ43034.1 protein translocase subunit SecD [Clostridium tarantellae]
MKTKVRSSIVFFISVAVIVFLAIAGFKGFVLGDYQFKTFNNVITKGLDLQGGVSVLMEIEGDNVTPEDLTKTKELLSLRVNKVGVSETVVTTEGDKRVRVDIPGAYDSNGIVESLEKTGELTFVGPDDNIILNGKDIKESKVTIDHQTAEPVITLKLNEEGTKKFAEATQKFLGQNIAIKMDGEVLTNPKVNTAITNGEAIISGNKSMEEAQKISGIINAGALPVPVKAVSVKTVGAQLGENALPNAMMAGLIGISLIFLFMILYYRVPGILSCLTLTVYILLVLYAFILVDVTLTLPGIAALLLTIGMAVDANVLIFERIKEELRNGKSIRTSIKLGFNNAMSSIIDSNVTTLLAGLVLYFLGSGPVKGFALTLLIGISISIFTAIVVTRFFMNLAFKMGMLNKPSKFGRVKGGK